MRKRNKRGRFVSRRSVRRRRPRRARRVRRARRASNPMRAYRPRRRSYRRARRRSYRRRRNPIRMPRLGLGKLGQPVAAVMGYQAVERGVPMIQRLFPIAFFATPVGKIVAEVATAYAGAKVLEMFRFTRPYAAAFMTGGIVKAGKSTFDMLLGPAGFGALVAPAAPAAVPGTSFYKGSRMSYYSAGRLGQYYQEDPTGANRSGVGQILGPGEEVPMIG